MSAAPASPAAAAAPPALVVIATVLNEGGSARPWLESLCAQTRRPTQVVIVDGGSSDDTLAVLKSYAGRLPLTVIEAPGCNISAGRNIAIRAAQALGGGDPIIAATDAGVVLAPGWLEVLALPFLADPALEVCSGFFEADPRTPFEVALGASTLPLLDEIDPDRFLPSSRSVAFRHSAWARVGGYPEWLDYCEDVVFDLALKQVAGPFGFVPGAVAAFRPRPSLPAFYKQYYRYARGDGKADLWRKRHAARYLTYGVGLPIGVALSLIWPPAGLLLIGAGLLYIRTPYRRLPIVWRRAHQAGAVRRTPAAVLWTIALVPITRFVGDLAKMNGYPAGVVWRLRHQRRLASAPQTGVQ